ncbi:MAG: class B sortase [Eubacteriales bacterium]
MSEEQKLKLVKVGIGLFGVILVISILGLYRNSFVSTEAHTQAVPAMTGEEIEVLLEEYRMDQTIDGEVEEAIHLIDFQSLQEINEDVYAWISIPGTNIEYPVLQHDYDDSYYLNYNIDGTYGYPGCIYTESVNNKDFQDNNTVLYGHNMKDGTMFAGLHDFQDGTFFEENRFIYIDTPEKVLTYEIFAAYVYDDRHILYSFDFADEKVYADYLEGIFERRSMSDNLNTSIEITSEDKVITLTTCISNQPNNRYLVQGVLLD